MSRENLEGMKEAAGDYYRYALEARREYLRLLGKSDKEVAKLYHASLRRILWEWRRGKNKGLVYLLEAIDEDSPQFEGELAARIDNAIKEGAAAGIRFSQMVTMAGLESVGMDKGPMVRAFEWCRKQSVNACYARTHKDGLFLSDRIWKTTKESRATMKAIVQAGIGEDAVKVARALEVYVNQGKTAACLQFPKMMERMKSRVPENLDYNALRLARTELSAAYGEATRAAAEASPAIGKLKWVLSGAHPKEDICDHHAKGGDGHGVYEARSCPIFPAHPNCLCNLQPAPDRPEDFARKMKEWLKDPASHPEVEDWYQKNYKPHEKEGSKPEKPPATPPEKKQEAKPRVSDNKTFGGAKVYMMNRYGVRMTDGLRNIPLEILLPTLQGIEDMIDEFPIAGRELTSVIGMSSKTAYMSASCDMIVKLNKAWLSNPARLRAQIQNDVKAGWSPKNTSIRECACHEMGHILEAILNKMANGKVNVSDWNNCIFASKIVNDAFYLVTKIPGYEDAQLMALKEEISDYALQDASECLAEAVADVMANGNRAALLSRAIWSQLKKELS